MVECDKFLVERVICDEIFFVEEDETGIPIGEVVVFPGSVLLPGGSVTVTVVNCEPVVDTENDMLGATVTFRVQKDFAIQCGNNPPIPEEFNSTFTETVMFRKCRLSQLGIVNPANLLCHILLTQIMDDCIRLTPSTFNCETRCFLKDATFDELLTVAFKVKITEQRQMFLSTCPANLTATAPITVCQDCGPCL